VIGPLIEVPVMLTLVWIARQTGKRLFRPAPDSSISSNSAEETRG